MIVTDAFRQESGVFDPFFYVAGHDNIAARPMSGRKNASGKEATNTR